MTIAITSVSSRRRRGTASVLHNTAAMLVAASLAGCSLLSRPEPMDTLQLLTPEVSSTSGWPDSLDRGEVSANAALQTDRVLVTDGALLMQHEGLRWVDVPATLLTEQLRARHARADASTTAETMAVATLDVWLTGFNIRIADGGSKTVDISAFGELRCARDGRRLRVEPVGASRPLTTADAAEIAVTFAQATDEMLTALLSTASTRARVCGAPAPRFPSNSPRP